MIRTQCSVRLQLYNKYVWHKVRKHVRMLILVAMITPLMTTVGIIPAAIQQPDV